MVAPVDTHLIFARNGLLARVDAAIVALSESGGGRILVCSSEAPAGSQPPQESVASLVGRARQAVGSAPLGFVGENAEQALEAIAAGADDADVLSQQDPAPFEHQKFTTFIDRVRLRARLRHTDERLSRNLSQAERLTALGTLLAGVGHELNNPLLMITLGVDYVRELLLPDLEQIWALQQKVADGAQLSPDDLARALRAMGSIDRDAGSILDELRGATGVVAELVNDLRVFSRRDDNEPPTLFHTGEAISQALRLVRREFGSNTIIEQDYEDDLPPLVLPRNRLAQVLTNLLVNAAHAMAEVEAKTHRLRVSARVDDQHVAISVSDTGQGIPDEALERIFDPFFTTKREGHGTGLGLAISRTVLQQLGGDLTVSSIYGEGATFVCFVPLPSAEQLANAQALEREPLPPQPPSAGRGAVLIVDDDERVLRATSRALSPHYKLLIASDGEEAVELLSSGSHADAVLMELTLAERDGPALYQWLIENSPHLKGRIVIATGAQERPPYRSFLETAGAIVLPKPFDKAALLAAMAGALGPVSEEAAPVSEAP